MPNYIRARVPGGTYFFTAHLQDRSSTLLTDEILRLRQSMRVTKQRYPFAIEAIVVLPASIHTIWTLPTGDSDYSNRWGMLKSLFSRGLPGPELRSRSQINRGDKGLWQRRFWEHVIRDTEDFHAHTHFIYHAPVRAGLCARPQDWNYSSIHRAIALKQWPLPTQISAA